MKKNQLSFKHMLGFLAVLLLLTIGIIQKHIERIRYSYEIGELKETKEALQEEERRLEALFSEASTPEVLLKRSKLIGLAFVPQREEVDGEKKSPKARPAEGDLHGH